MDVILSKDKSRITNKKEKIQLAAKTPEAHHPCLSKIIIGPKMSMRELHNLAVKVT